MKSKLLEECKIGLRYGDWTFVQMFFYLLSEIVQGRLGISVLARKYINFVYNRYKYVDEKGLEYLKIGDIKMSALSMYNDKVTFEYILYDTFLSYLRYNDSYEKDVFLKLDEFLHEGLYGYKDELIDVTVKPNDVVIDVGAWIGDFSAYCAHKNAKVYAFEPSDYSYKLLETTAMLNDNKIIPVKVGLGSEQTTLRFSTDNSGRNAVLEDATVVEDNSEIITITTLDKFVEEFDLKSVDFIKVDIEGYEREFLKGAKSAIQRFLPKIAICTYHLPDDPEVLETIIKGFNPNYRIFHSRHKLFAQYVSPVEHSVRK